LIAAVLFGGLCHATWNIIVKSGADKPLDMMLVIVGSAAVALPCTLLVGPLNRQAWPYIAGSTAIHLLYYLSLVQAYRSADLSVVYPIMRGMAPLILALLGLAFLGESLSPGLLLGIVLVSVGVCALAALRWPVHADMRKPLMWAALNAAVIAAYTLVDGAGVRVANTPLAYVVWTFALHSLPFALIVLLRRGAAGLGYLRHHAARAVGGGLLSFTSYGIALWAMTQAPVAAVAALRETSVLFGVLLSAWLLREPVSPHRWAGAALVVAGVVVLRLSRS
jgi:drug/metabolite transporter (DMT)-like permease